MEIKKLQINSEFKQEKKLTERLECFDQLINELEKKNLPPEIVDSINQDIDEINTFSGSANSLLTQLKKKQSKILKLIEKELKLVTKNHYRNMWLALGMSAFGLPIGVAFGITVGNIGLLAIGLPIGMVIGMAVGSSMDKKAKESGKQLDVEIKY